MDILKFILFSDGAVEAALFVLSHVFLDQIVYFLRHIADELGQCLLSGAIRFRAIQPLIRFEHLRCQRMTREWNAQ